MEALYEVDLAYIHAVGFGGLATGAAPAIVEILKHAPLPVRRVVDVGCGAGQLTVALVDAGFEVTAIDNSPGLLAAARSACPGARFVAGSIHEWEVPACEAIVALGEVLTYGSGTDADESVERFFQRAAAVLPAGGMLIFDIIETGEPSLASRSWKAGEDWAVLVETTEDRAARRLIRDIQTFRRIGDLYRRGREVHTVRLFDTETLLGQLAECGFQVETAASYGEQPLAPRRRAFVATRV